MSKQRSSPPAWVSATTRDLGDLVITLVCSMVGSGLLVVPYTFFVFRPTTSDTSTSLTSNSSSASTSSVVLTPTTISSGDNGDASSTLGYFVLIPTMLLLLGMFLQLYATHLVTLMTLRGVVPPSSSSGSSITSPSKGGVVIDATTTATTITSENVVSIQSQPFRSFREMLVWVSDLATPSSSPLSQDDRINGHDTTPTTPQHQEYENVDIIAVKTPLLSNTGDSPSSSSSRIACWQSRLLDVCVGISAWGCLIVFIQYSQSQCAAIRVALFPSTSSSGDGDEDGGATTWRILDTLIPSVLFCLASCPLSYRTLRFSSWTGSSLTLYVAALGTVLVAVVEPPVALMLQSSSSSSNSWVMNSDVLPPIDTPPLWRTVFTAIGIFVSLYSCQYALPLYLHALVPKKQLPTIVVNDDDGEVGEDVDECDVVVVVAVTDKEDTSVTTTSATTSPHSNNNSNNWSALPETRRFSGACAVAMIFAFAVYFLVGIQGNVTMEVLSTSHSNWQVVLGSLETSAVASASSSSSSSNDVVVDGCWIGSIVSSSFNNNATTTTTTSSSSVVSLKGGGTCDDGGYVKDVRTGWAGCRGGGDWVSCITLLDTLLDYTHSSGHTRVGTHNESTALPLHTVIIMTLGVVSNSSSTNSSSSSLVSFVVATDCFALSVRGGGHGGPGCWMKRIEHTSTLPNLVDTIEIKGLSSILADSDILSSSATEKAVSALLWTLRVLLLVHFLGAFPLFAITTRKALLSGFFARDEDELFEAKAAENNNKRTARELKLYTVVRALVTAVLVVPAAALAYQSPNGVVLVFALNGALMGNLTSVALPCWMFVKYKLRMASSSSDDDSNQGPPYVDNDDSSPNGDHHHFQHTTTSTTTIATTMPALLGGWVHGGVLPWMGAGAGVVLAVMGTITWLFNQFMV